MSGLCKVWGFFFPFLFFGQLGTSLVYSAFNSLRCFSLRCFSAVFLGCFFFFFHGGVPVWFSVEVCDAVGVGNAHPTALKMKVEDKWWKMGTCVSDFE